MVRYEKFGLGETWNTEYGSAAVPEELGWLLSYSPYHRVAAGTAYPSVLFTVFTNDTRVHPMHAYKMCAALQHAARPRGTGPLSAPGKGETASPRSPSGPGPRETPATPVMTSTATPRQDRVILLRAEGQVGHGARAVSLTAELAGDALAFVARETGLSR
jgi:prolyl oligopeptidase